MGLTLTEGGWIEFFIQVITLVCLDNYYILFYDMSYKEVQ